MSYDLFDRIEDHESCRLTVYDDATGKSIQAGSHVIGNPTIGIGTLICAPGGITRNEADMLMRNRVSQSIAQVKSLVPGMQSANSARFDVLVEMAYQMGIVGLGKFVNTIRAVREQRWDDAADGMLASLWARQTPSRAQALAKVMRSGQA